MRKQLWAMAIVIGLALAIQFGCGGGTPRTGGGLGLTPGSVVVFGGDAPLCSILSFTITVNGITLTPQTGGSAVSILPAGKSVTLDYASLIDFTTFLTFANVNPGTYSAMTLTLSNPQLTYLDTTQDPPAPATIAPTFSSLTVNLDLNPAVTVEGDGTVGLQLDFNLLQSVQLDDAGQITGEVTPAFTVNQATPSASTGFTEIDDLRGIVQSVTPTSANTAFTASLQVQPSGGPALTVNVTSSTTFDGVSDLSALATGTYVEVQAFIDASGNIVAQEVVAEADEDAAAGKAAFRGLITAVTRDSSGNATQFTLFVAEEAPDVSAEVPLRSALTFNVLSSSSFAISAPGANLASFAFGPTTLGIGQQVVVHGQLPSPVTAPPAADARSVYLGLQPILGDLSTDPTTPLTIGSDGKTGGFTLLPCSPVFQSQPITEITYFQTAFTGLTDLNDFKVPGQHFLSVKGLLFYQQTPGQVNSVTWVPPASVQVATGLHQISGP
jgi:hypothetical protein